MWECEGLFERKVLNHCYQILKRNDYQLSFISLRSFKKGVSKAKMEFA